jgi:iron complex transport system ATP-binding protein
MMAALRWRDVSLDKGGRLVLDSVSLALNRGELLGVVGPNGAGKTALLRCALGLEGRGHAGRIDLGGIPVSGLSPGKRAKAMAYVPQEGAAAWPITVADAVALGRLPHGGGEDEEDCRIVASALDAVGMGPFAERKITALSGGERALVLLARALAVQSEVLLLDEPAAALDPHHQLATMDLLRRLAGLGKAICVVLHDLSVAARFCHRVAVLHRGRLAAEGAPGDILTDGLLHEVYAIRGVRRRIGGSHLLVPWERLPALREK